MSGFSITDLFKFDRMISVVLIKFAYWIGLILGTLTAIGNFFMAFDHYGGGIGYAFTVLISWIGGILVWRMVCEGVIVLFSIYERLGDIRTALTQPR